MAKIELTQGKFASFDDEDAATILQHKWHAVRGGHTFYAATKVGGKRVLLHRMLMNLEIGDPMMVDHKDGDGLNNKRTNLRVVDALLNQRNRKANSNNSSGVHGVIFRENHGKAGAWVATAVRDGRLVTRTFGCLKRGSDEAKRLAIEWRKRHEDEYEITIREGAVA